MIPTWLIGFGCFCMIFIAASGMVLLKQAKRDQRLAARIKLSQGIEPKAEEKRERVAKRAWAGTVSLLGQLILRTGLLSARTRSELEASLRAAGFRGSTSLEIFIGSKLSMAIILPFVANMLERAFVLPWIVGIIIPLAAAVVGLLSPDIVVRRRRARYMKRVERGLPDVLDLLVICLQAGLGLTAAITRVSEEMHHGREAIGVELALTANELQFLDARTALLNLGSRTDIRGLVRLGTTLVQSMQYGTPLTSAMRQLSAEIRQEILTRFEAKAARLGVVLTVPMIVFILPCVFLVVGGPAAVQVMQIGK